MKKVLPFIAVQILTLTPLIALAQAANGGGDFGRLGNIFTSATAFINNTLIPLVFALALLVFFYGIFKYFILGGGDESSRAEGRQLMLWAIIGFVVMASLYGIITLIQTGLGLGNNSVAPTLPSAPGGGGSRGR